MSKEATTYRKCRKCKVAKALSAANFPVRRDKPSGFLTQCRPCWRAYYRAYYRKNKRLVEKYERVYREVKGL